LGKKIQKTAGGIFLTHTVDTIAVLYMWGLKTMPFVRDLWLCWQSAWLAPYSFGSTFQNQYATNQIFSIIFSHYLISTSNFFMVFVQFSK